VPTDIPTTVITMPFVQIPKEVIRAHVSMGIKTCTIMTSLAHFVPKSMNASVHLSINVTPKPKSALIFHPLMKWQCVEHTTAPVPAPATAFSKTPVMSVPVSVAPV
jgi:hypothetical protein